MKGPFLKVPVRTITPPRHWSAAASDAVAIGDVGRLIGARYRVDRELARGPNSHSLLVTDLRNGRACVLRQLSEAAATPAQMRRFDAQGAILARLDHPGLPRFIESFFEGEGAARRRVLVTSYHPGESLERLVVKGRPLSEGQAIALLRRLVPVLEYLHAFDPPLVHRTIRASGITVGPDGRPCLTDLDYAAAAQADPDAVQSPPGPEELVLVPPEVFAGGAVPATDIYALGLAIMHGMTGDDPSLLLSDASRQRLRLALGASEAFAAVIARMLEPSLERRYPDAGALNADLARFAGVRGAAAQQPPRVVQPVRDLEEPAPKRSSRFPALAGIALALLVLAGLFGWMGQLRQPAPEPIPQVPTVVQERESGPAPATTEPPGAVAAPPADSAAQQAAPPTAAVEPLVEPPVVAVAPAAAPALVPPPADALPAVSVEGRLLLDGKPFAREDAPAPLFWFRDEATKTEVKPQVEAAAGRFTVRGLPPGRYGMSVRIDLNRQNPNIFPGDLNAWSDFTIGAGPPPAIDLTLRTVLHLQQPVDNAAAINGWDVPCGAGSVLSAQVLFAWEPLEPGTSYEASVDRLLCSRGYAPAGRVFTQSTSDAWVKVELPPSAAGECYSFRLTARRDGRTVGVMATHGKSGLGWDHRFTVAGR